MMNRHITIPDGYKHILLELSTGFGKTHNALSFIHKLQCKRPLIVLPKRVLEDTWNKELIKWNLDSKIKPVYIQYMSFIKPNKWLKYKNQIDSIIYDEVHNLSPRAIGIIDKYSKYLNTLPIVLLSATVTPMQKKEYRRVFNNLYEVRANLASAIQHDILPKPIICYVKLKLTNHQRLQYNIIQNKCLYLKQQIKSSPNKEKAYLHQCKIRNVWLAKQKDFIVKQLHSIYNKPDYKSITFCADIEQCSNILPKANITSKNTKSQEVLSQFNNDFIQHITACNMLNEGVNLNSCRLGIFAYLTISERITTQQLGRLLRHPKPIVYILYYENTREEVICKTIYKRFKNASETRIFAYEKIQSAYNKLTHSQINGK